MAIDERAARGFKAAEHYDAYRPGYPPAAVAFIREAARLDHRSTVVDVGAGSGLMTRLLKPVGRLIAVEPLPEMRETLRARVPEAEVVEGTAERMPLPSGVADAVVAAQAFHWFATSQAVCELGRVLKPEGALVLVWNQSDLHDRLQAAIDAVLEPYRADTPRFASIPWRAVFEAGSSPLVITEHAVFPWEEPLTLGVLKGRARSYSYIATLGGPGQAAVMNTLDEVAAACLGGPVTDETPLSIKHVTEVFVARRR